MLLSVWLTHGTILNSAHCLGTGTVTQQAGNLVNFRLLLDWRGN